MTGPVCRAVGVGLGDLAAVVGAGGKTTLMFRLVAELRRDGVRAAAATTTKIFRPGPVDGGRLACGSVRELARVLAGWSWAAGSPFPVLGAAVSAAGKVDGVDPAACAELLGAGLVDAVVVEADGAGRRPVKAPEPWEPVVPGGTTVFAAVVGLGCVGRPFDDRTAFRLERMAAVTGLSPGDPISPDAIVRLLARPGGLAERCPPGVRAVAVLNQADLPGAAEAGRQIARAVVAAPGRFDRAVVARLAADDPIVEVVDREEPV